MKKLLLHILPLPLCYLFGVWVHLSFNPFEWYLATRSILLVFCLVITIFVLNEYYNAKRD
jgi:hypothetical protein